MEKLNKTPLAWDYDEYYPYRLEQMDERALRKEYTRLRKVANKRLARLQASKYKDSELAKEYAGGFEILANVADLPRELTALARFVASEKSSISGLKRMETKAVSTLQQHGYTFVNAGNVGQFGEFMEEMRQAGLSKLYSSEFIATWWSERDASKRDNIGNLKREFEKYVNQNMDN